MPQSSSSNGVHSKSRGGAVSGQSEGGPLARLRKAERATEMAEMLERPPSWMMRWGLVAFTGTILLLVGISAFIRYPDVVEGRAALSSDPAPVWLAPATGTYIVRLLAKDGARLQKGSPVAELENSTGYRQVLALGQLVDSIRNALTQENKGFSITLKTPLTGLGELQEPCNRLLEALEEWRAPSRSSTGAGRAASALSGSVETLYARLQDWKKRYLLVSPYNGTLRYARTVRPDARMEAGEKLFLMLPEEKTYIATMFVPAQNAGDVKAGQRARLLLPQYPYGEYGFLEGLVTDVSPGSPSGEESSGGSPQQMGYTVTIALPDSLITTFRHPVPFQPGMPATGQIVTSDRTVLQRLLSGASKKLGS